MAKKRNHIYCTFVYTKDNVTYTASGTANFEGVLTASVIEDCRKLFAESRDVDTEDLVITFIKEIHGAD
jgi:hypothetical protein